MAPSASVGEDAPVVLVVDDVHVNRRVAKFEAEVLRERVRPAVSSWDAGRAR